LKPGGVWLYARVSSNNKPTEDCLLEYDPVLSGRNNPTFQVDYSASPFQDIRFGNRVLSDCKSTEG